MLRGYVLRLSLTCMFSCSWGLTPTFPMMGRGLRVATHWAAIPSMPAKAGEHPLRQLVTQAAPGLECKLQGAPTASNPRAISSEHFWMEPVPEGAHVLLIDDTWTSGGYAQPGSTVGPLVIMPVE